MPYVAPSTVVAGQTYSAANHNIIVNDIIDHEDRLDTVQNAQYPARNVLVNGAMQFSQRGTSVSGITTGGYYTADRWNAVIGTAGTWTQAITADTPTGQGFRNALRMTCTTAVTSLSSSAFGIIQQKLEGQTLQHIKKGTANAQQLTLQFWVKSGTTGTYICELSDEDNTRRASGSYTISAANTWEQKTITFPADTTGVLDNDNASSFSVEFWVAAGSNFTSGTLQTTWGSSVNANRAVGQTNLAAAVNNYIQITGVQLEPGSQASPFEFVRYDDELARCQRYYYRITPGAANSFFGAGQCASTSQGLVYVPFPTQMRVRPTALETTGTAGDYVVLNANTTSNTCTVAPTFNGSTTAGAAVNFTASATLVAGNASFLGVTGASGYLGFSAEL